MKRAHVSSVDVARVAGVSQSAVSRAYKPGSRISEATRARIHAAAARLGYQPNALARGLLKGRSGMVALVTGEVDNPFHARSTALLSEALQARGYHVLLFTVRSDDAVDSAVAELLRYRVDGVLIASAALSAAMADACGRVGTPVLLYNRYPEAPGVGSVRMENYDGGRRVADFLIAGGHARIALIGGTRVDGTAYDRESGFSGRLRERGIELVGVAEGDYGFATGGAAMRELWARCRPDAVFATSDLMAIGAMETARREIGLDIPGDLSIVGFDDLPVAAWPSYDLTTMRQPVEAMSDAAVGMLLEKIAEPSAEARTLLLPGELKVRGSARVSPPSSAASSG